MKPQSNRIYPKVHLGQYDPGLAVRDASAELSIRETSVARLPSGDTRHTLTVSLHLPFVETAIDSLIQFEAAAPHLPALAKIQRAVSSEVGGLEIDVDVSPIGQIALSLFAGFLRGTKGVN